MKLHHQEAVRDALYKAIDKVITDQSDRGHFEDIIQTESMTELVTNSAMKTITDLHEYYRELLDNGNINS